MKYYIIKQTHLPFHREWSIYNNLISTNKEYLIEVVRLDLEKEVLLEPTKLTLTSDNFLLVNESTDKWLKVHELTLLQSETQIKNDFI